MATSFDLSLHGARLAGASADRIGDPGGERTVVSIVVLLVALGLALVMVSIWLYKVTRPDPELLAPLEVMSDRSWRRGDPVWQRRRLDEVRPRGAQPLERVAAPPSVDEAFEKGPQGTGFDDLHADAAPAAAEPGPDDDLPPPAADERVAATPPGTERPSLDELPSGELDPDLLAAAMADLDAELGPPVRRRSRSVPEPAVVAAEPDEADPDGDAEPDDVDPADAEPDEAEPDDDPPHPVPNVFSSGSGPGGEPQAEEFASGDAADRDDRSGEEAGGGPEACSEVTGDQLDDPGVVDELAPSSDGRSRAD